MKLLREMLSGSTADGSRTNALNHLQWMVAAFAVLLTAAFFANAPVALLVILGGALMLFLACYVVTHFYFMVKDPDALRSETFKIQKMQIERGLLGDDRGMREVVRGEPVTMQIGTQEGGER